MDSILLIGIDSDISRCYDRYMSEYVGNLHVHSTYSDGTGTIEEIAEAARDCGAWISSV